MKRAVGRPFKGSASAAPISSAIEPTGLLDGVRVRVVLDRVPDDGSQLFVLDQDGLERPVSVAQVIELRIGRT